MILGQKPISDTSKRIFYKTIKNKGFLYEIVSNEENSVDVDKFDYLCRDSYNVGVKNIHFDPIQLIENTKIINNSLSFNCDQDYCIYGLFQARYQMFKSVYTERINVGINHMIADALLKANSKFKFTEILHNPAEYIKITDCIFDFIEHSKCPELNESRAILQRIKYRDLYKFCGEVILDPHTEKRIGEIENEKIANYGIGIDPRDFVISKFKINYGCKDKNPVENIWFYNNDSGIFSTYFIPGL